jgi:hypothetical protein
MKREGFSHCKSIHAGKEERTEMNRRQAKVNAVPVPVLCGAGVVVETWRLGAIETTVRERGEAGNVRRPKAVSRFRVPARNTTDACVFSFAANGSTYILELVCSGKETAS